MSRKARRGREWKCGREWKLGRNGRRKGRESKKKDKDLILLYRVWCGTYICIIIVSGCGEVHTYVHVHTL